MKNRLLLLVLFALSSLQLVQAKIYTSSTKEPEQIACKVCRYDNMTKAREVRHAQPTQYVKTRRVYKYIPDEQLSIPITSYYDAKNPYYDYWERSYWRPAYYGGYPYGYWPSFGTGFGYGGRRGSYTFGFAW